MLRSILHCDMNNFYASVECMLDPALKKYPIAVCGSVEERHGIVLAKNYKAKAFDVKTGDAVWQAKQKCMDLVVVPPHYEEYEENEKMRAVLKATGFDEYFFKGKDQNGCESEKQANRIQERVNPNSQNGEGELTYSVYYSAPSVISEVFIPYKNVES